MSKNLVLFLFACTAVAVVFSSYVSGPPAGVTNAPGETTCYNNSGCHVGTANTGPGMGEITIMGGVPSCGYYPDSTYIIMPYVTDTAQMRFGFQAVALDSNNMKVGSVTLLDTIKTQIVDSTIKEYVEHTFAGTTVTGTQDWLYEWTAPSAGAGTVTFYVAFNAANGDFTPMGDRIYTDSLVLPECIISGVGENNEIVGSVFPNPVSNNVNVSLSRQVDGPISVQVFDMVGNLVYEQSEQVHYHQLISINTESWSEQMYLLRLSDMYGNQSTRKVCVVR